MFFVYLWRDKTAAMFLVGREKNIEQFDRLYRSSKSEFVAIYGRRRVGKTYLVRSLYSEEFCFYHTGLANSSMHFQLENFYISLKKFGPSLNFDKPSNWLEAFELLKLLIDQKKAKRKVIFIDELPWLDTHRSNFLAAFEQFWNSWASHRKDILLIACGSASSWMINKLLNNKRGLHNRVTARMNLKPFTLAETKSFLEAKNIQWDNYQIIRVYMAMGGVPFYLEAIEKGWSADQAIDNLFFAEEGLLRNEYHNLYASLFDSPDNYLAIITALAKTQKGLTRDELVKHSGIKSGGYLSRILEELEQSGFIRIYTPFSKKKRESLHQLIDFYSAFYFKFIRDQNVQSNDWMMATDAPSIRAWSGFAFEQICLTHIQSIKEALGISAVQTTVSSWRSVDGEGAQVDLVLDRRDQIIHLFEVKFSISSYAITKKYASELRHKLGTFQEKTQTKKNVFLSMITTYGLTENLYSGLVQNSLDMSIFFKQEPFTLQRPNQ
jgi:AAA+ ATPase superfamily predicted ATPase